MTAWWQLEDDSARQRLVARGALLVHEFNSHIVKDELGTWYRNPIAGRDFLLDPPVEVDLAPTGDGSLTSIAQFRKYYSNTPELRDAFLSGHRASSTSTSPPSEHHIKPTRLRSQGSRNTCTTFATIAAFEAALLKRESIEVDLSEDFAHTQLHMLANPHVNLDLNLPLLLQDVARTVRMLKVAPEAEWPYSLDQNLFNSSPQRGNPPAGDRRISVRTLKRFSNHEIDEIHNARNFRLLESLISTDTPVIIVVEIGGADENGFTPDTLAISGLHCIMLNGYDRDAGIFLAKDSGASRLDAVWKYEYIALRARYAIAFTDYAFTP